MAVNLVARLNLDSKPFYAALGGVKNEVSKVNGKISGDLKTSLLGVFSVGAIGASLKSVANYASNIRNLSDQYDITNEEAQKFDAITQANGLSFEKFLGVIDKVGSARKAAVEGNEEMAKAFARFGVSLESINKEGVRNVDVVYKLANATNSLQSAADREAFGELTGATGKRFLSLLGKINDATPIVLMSDDELKKLDDASSKLQALARDYTSVLGKVVGKGVDTYETISKNAGGGTAGQLLGGVLAPFGIIQGLIETIQDGLNPSLAKDPVKSFDALPLPSKEKIFEEKKKETKDKNEEKMSRDRLSLNPESNSMSRIGLFTGGVPVSMVSIGREQLAEIKRQTQVMRDVKRVLEKGL